MTRFPFHLFLLPALAIAAGCATVPRNGSQEPPSPESAGGSAAPAPPEEPGPEPGEASPPDVPVELRGVPVTLEELARRLAVRDYRFSAESGVEVSLTLENRTAEEHFSLLLATSFRGRDGEEIFQTRWTPVELAPRRRHYYHSQTGDPFARSASVLVQVLDWPDGEAAAEEE